MALKVAVIGATGSVGKQTLEVIDRFPDKFVPTLLVGGKNVELLQILGKKYGCSVFSPWLHGPAELPLDRLESSDIMVYAASTVDYLNYMSHFWAWGSLCAFQQKKS